MSDFKKMRRMNQALPDDECIEILKSQPRGTLSMMGIEGYPYGIPMNHFYLDGKLYFHTAKSGHKLDAISQNNHVSFCVLNDGQQVENDWWLRFNSVIVFGTIKKIDDLETTTEIVRKFANKHYPSPETVEIIIKRSIKKVQLLELTIDHMTGKKVEEN